MPIYYATKTQCLFARVFDAEQPRKKTLRIEPIFYGSEEDITGKIHAKDGDNWMNIFVRGISFPRKKLIVFSDLFKRH